MRQPSCSYRCTHSKRYTPICESFSIASSSSSFFFFVFGFVSLLFHRGIFFGLCAPQDAPSTSVGKRLHSNLFEYKMCSRYNYNVDRVHKQLKSHVSSVATKTLHCVTHDGACDCCIATHVSNLSLHNRPTNIYGRI